MAVPLSEQNDHKSFDSFKYGSRSLNILTSESNEIVFRRHFSDFDYCRDNDRDSRPVADVKCNRFRMGTLVERQQSKAVRVRFYRNLNPFFVGIVVPVSRERYRTFEALLRELTRLLKCRVVLSSGICKIVRINGTLVRRVEQFFEDDVCVCCCRYEIFKNVGYKSKLEQRSPMAIRYEGFVTDKKRTPKKLVLPQLFKDLFVVDEPLLSSEWSDLYCVRHSHWRSNHYVMKCVPLDNSNKFLRNEKSILLMLQSHENIINLVMSYESPNQIVYVFERLRCDLHQLRIEFGLFSDRTAQIIVRKLARGLNYMHNKLIVHRDVKLENILVNCDTEGNILELKITDFGLSVLKGVGPLYKWCGTAGYMAPEMLTRAGYNHLVDCWAMGVLLFLGLTGDIPFGSLGMDKDKIFDAIQNENYNSNILASIPVRPSLCELVCALLSKCPCVRPNAAEILGYRFTNETI